MAFGFPRGRGGHQFAHNMRIGTSPPGPRGRRLLQAVWWSVDDNGLLQPGAFPRQGQGSPTAFLEQPLRSRRRAFGKTWSRPKGVWRPFQPRSPEAVLTQSYGRSRRAVVRKSQGLLGGSQGGRFTSFVKETCGFIEKSVKDFWGILEGVPRAEF